MSSSFALFDSMFVAAHMLKIISYAVMLVGLQLDSFHLFRQAEGASAVLSTGRDSVLTERNLLRAVMDNLPDYIFCKNEAGQFIATNDAHAKALGAEGIEDVIGKSDFDFYPRQQAERYYEDDQLVFRSGEAVCDRVDVGIDPRVTARSLLTTKVPLKDDRGNVVGLVGICRDVSALQNTIQRTLRDLETARAKSDQHAANLERVVEELEQFVYIATHDLQEPVRSLVAYSTLLREDVGDHLSDDAATDLKYIQTAATRMQALITDLLNYSRAGTTATRSESVSLDTCVDNSLEALRSQLTETGASVERQPLPTVSGDPTLLTQVYQNLISSALKYSRAADPVVELTAQVQDGEWTLGVRDNGIGLEPQYAEQIFEPFKRLHGVGEYSGTGIGLAICRKNISRLGGRIWVDSKPDQGAHFKFTFPHSREELEP